MSRIDADRAEPAESADSAGGTPRRRGRFLSQDAIVDSALRLVVAEGIDRLTIRRIAGDLDAAPMALYRHFPDKRSLQAAMLRRLADGMPPVPTSGPPRDQVVASALDAHEYLHANPWVVPLLREGAYVPDDLEFVHHQLAMLTELGLGREAAISAHTAIWWLILGHLASMDVRAPVVAAAAALGGSEPGGAGTSAGNGEAHAGDGDADANAWAGVDLEAIFRHALVALVDGLLAAADASRTDATV